MCALCGGRRAAVPSTQPWRAFAAELGLLFQIVDDMLDGDGYVLDVGGEGAPPPRGRGGGARPARLAAIDADTGVLAEIVDELAARTA